MAKPWRILVAVDFSPASRAALAEARRLALELKATVILVHAYKAGPPGRTLASLSSHGEAPLLRESERMHLDEANQLSSQWAELLRREDIPVEVEARDGRPVDVILETARELAVDLVVLGRQGMGRVGRLIIGSVSTEVAKRCHVPVVIVPEAEAPSRKTG